jgi:hypothetical protein
MTGEETRRPNREASVGVWQALRQGAVLGIFACVIASGVFAACVAVAMSLGEAAHGPGAPWTGMGSLLVDLGRQLVGVSQLSALATLLPGICSGAAVALLLRGLMYRRHVAPSTGLLIGAPIGLLTGLAITAVVAWAIGRTLARVAPLACLACGIATAAGAWHGRQVVRWLQGKMARV